MSNFKKFSSLENHYREKFIDFCRTSTADLSKFIATEKVHGANFSFWVGDEGVRVAKRSGFTDGTFYGCQEVIDRYAPALEDLWKRLKYPNIDGKGKTFESRITQIVIYGELYGEGVQKEVAYGAKDFIAFDAHLHYPDNEVVIQDKASAVTLASISKIPFVPIIAVGSMDELLDIDVESMTSKVATKNNLNESIVEGVVIEPVDPCFLDNGSRLIIKKKSKAFSETKSRKPKEPPKPLSPEAEKLYQTSMDYITSNRLSNVISHVGFQKRSDFGKVIGMLMSDVSEEVNKEHPELADAVEKSERKRVSKMLTTTCAETIKANWDDVFEM